MSNVLVTGGAGYVGSVLIDHLLAAGHRVTVVDNLLYDNGSAILTYFKRDGFHFVKGDVRDTELLRSVVESQAFVIHLAAIVGFPACERSPDLARSTNLDATKSLSSVLRPDQGVIFASTGSNYGSLEGEVCTEETPLHPVSLYGKTKTEAERWLLDHNETVAYRFATAFGVSPRMRLDLLVNDFVYEALINQYLIMFERDFKRTFIHVDDMARSFVFALENFEAMRGGVYNVGDRSNNFSKEEVALRIREKADFYLHFANVGEDMDKRNYEVSYDKINAAGFRARISLDEGIDELMRAIPALEHRGVYRNV